jgi:hypothetical protein
MHATRSLAGLALVGATLLTGCSLLMNPAATLPADASEAVWHLDPDAPPPGPAATSFVAMVTERACSGGRDISDLLLPPAIQYGEDLVVVSLYVEPRTADAADCIGTLPTRFTIELSEPLGDRQLVDGIGGTDDDPV